MRWSRCWQRRRRVALAVAAVPVLAAIAAAYLAEPAYRATASLRIDGRMSSTDPAEAAAREEAVEHVRGLHRRVLAAQALSLTDRSGMEVNDIAVSAAPDGRLSVSIAFDVFAEGADPRTAERIVTELVEQYVATDGGAVAVAVSAPPALETARLETERLAADRRAIEVEVDAFRRSNAGVLGATVDDAVVEQAGAALQQAQRERLQMEGQIAALEARRIELDRGLRDMQPADIGPRDETALSSEALAALQTEWAILRGRHGRDYAPADELAGRIARVQSEASRRLSAATAEIQDARAELARLERLHTIEHPDVVAQAHTLSAMESRFDALRVQGLTNAEMAYIESLAQERRNIDARIAAARERHAGVAAIVAEHEARASTAPALQQQYLALTQRLEAARTMHEAARTLQDSFEAEFAALQAQRPGRLSVAAAPQARRALLTQPPAILAFGAALAVFAALVVVAVMERVDRRIAGAASIRRIPANAELVVEIPVISLAGSGGRGRPAAQAAA